MSYRVNSNDVYPDLDECRFPSREVAEEIAEVVEECGTEYCSLTVEEAEGEPQFENALDYFAVTWPGYPGACPEGVSWEDWLTQNNVD
jgi:hypothetical protein